MFIWNMYIHLLFFQNATYKLFDSKPKFEQSFCTKYTRLNIRARHIIEICNEQSHYPVLPVFLPIEIIRNVKKN